MTIIFLFSNGYSFKETRSEAKMEEKKGFFTSKNIAVLGILSAFVVILQIFGSYFRIGTVQLSFVLVPIVLGGILTGVYGGAILGFLFGVITLIMGIVGVDQFTFILFSDHPVLTILTCIVKATAAGALSGLVYGLISKKNKTAAVFSAAAIAPIVNTSLFIVGALFMSDTLNANFVQSGSSVIYFLIIGCAGVNFLVELAINLLLAPSIYRIIKVVKK